MRSKARASGLFACLNGIAAGLEIVLGAHLANLSLARGHLRIASAAGIRG